eukprot:scaffold747_cov120-Cylindrotheca_fusiformis.AAC.24
MVHSHVPDIAAGYIVGYGRSGNLCRPLGVHALESIVDHFDHYRTPSASFRDILARHTTKRTSSFNLSADIISIDDGVGGRREKPLIAVALSLTWLFLRGIVEPAISYVQGTMTTH